MLERGVCHLLLLGTGPISGIVQAIVVPHPPRRCSQIKTNVQGSCEDQLSHKGLR